MSRKKTYREYKKQTGKKIPPTDKHGYYLNKGNRFFLGKLTNHGKVRHPAAVVGENEGTVLYVMVTHSTGGRYGKYRNPDTNDSRPVGLQHNVQISPDNRIYFVKKYSNYSHEPIDSGLDRLIAKSKKGNKK